MSANSKPGAPRKTEYIPLSVPSIRGNEWTYVKECLDTEWVSSAGKYVESFEQKVTEYTGAAYAVACVNGTAALQIALQLVGVQPGDEVLVPTLTFIAPVNAIRYLHAEPVFMDADNYYNINAEKTVRFIQNETEFRDGNTYNRTTHKRIAAVVPIHVFGNAVDLDPLLSMCSERNIPVVEDATESLGTYYTVGALSGRHAGTIGAIGCLSFNGNKIITTGGGGMILTDDQQLAEKARYLTTQAKDDPVRYIHDEVGYNFRLTNIQAALGVAQLEQLPKFLEIKKSNFKAYQQALADIDGLVLADGPAYADNNHWMYALQIDEEVYGRDRESLMAYLGDQGIETRPVWHLNHLQKPYRDCQSYAIDQALTLAGITLNIPCSSNLSPEDRDYVIEKLVHA